MKRGRGASRKNATGVDGTKEKNETCYDDAGVGVGVHVDVVVFTAL